MSVYALLMYSSCVLCFMNCRPVWHCTSVDPIRFKLKLTTTSTVPCTAWTANKHRDQYFLNPQHWADRAVSLAFLALSIHHSISSQCSLSLSWYCLLTLMHFSDHLRVRFSIGWIRSHHFGYHLAWLIQGPNLFWSGYKYLFLQAWFGGGGYVGSRVASLRDWR